MTKYNTNQASLSLHADNEVFIDQDKAICSFSLGCERTIEFWEQGRKPRKVKDIRMTHNSIVIMKPGTQQNLKHCVRAELMNNSKGKQKSQVRYSLSFRAVAKSSPTTQASPTAANNVQAPTNTVGFPGPATSPSKTATAGKPICLIAGDSYAARMESAKLEKNKVKVVKLAEGGAKIAKVQMQLEKYAADNDGASGR